MHKTVYLLDKSSGQHVSLVVKGHGEEQMVQLGNHTFSLGEFLNVGAMSVLTSDDINAEKRKFQSEVAALEPKEGQGSGATALTASPFSSVRTSRRFG